MAIVNKSELIKLRKKLGSDEAIAKVLKISRYAIHDLRTEYGISTLRTDILERDKKIVALYKTGLTGNAIAKQLGISRSQTYRSIKEGMTVVANHYR